MLSSSGKEETMNIRPLLGVVCILLGAYLFLNDSGSFGPGTIFAYFWPSFFVLPAALLLHWLHFGMLERKAPGLLIPGGILFTAGIVCQISMLFNIWTLTWPGFILAPAVGLFEFYWFGGRNKWLLIPINILTVLSLLFFGVFSISALFSEFSGQPIVAAIVVILGFLLMFGTSKKRA